MSTISCDGNPAPRRSYVQARVIRLSYLEWGREGPVVLLLHGVTSSARGWWRVAPALVALGYHVYAFDMPGHGESAETRDHTIDTIAGIIGAGARGLGLDEIVLIGHSWGGATALALASRVAVWGMIQRVVLVDPALHGSRHPTGEPVRNYLRGVGRPRAENLPIWRTGNPNWHDCDAFWKAEALEQCREAAVIGFFQKSGTWDFVPRLGEVTVPMLLMVSDPAYTVLSPEVQAGALTRLRPGSGEMVILEGASHSPFRDSFEMFMEELAEWLGRTA